MSTPFSPEQLAWLAARFPQPPPLRRLGTSSGASSLADALSQLPGTSAVPDLPGTAGSTGPPAPSHPPASTRAPPTGWPASAATGTSAAGELFNCSLLAT